jgi:hypothetical protein
MKERQEERLHPPHIGGGLGGGGCLFASFSAPEKVRNKDFNGKTGSDRYLSEKRYDSFNRRTA